MKFLFGITASLWASLLFALVGCTSTTSDGGAGGSPGLCTNAEDTAVFETLEYSNDDGDLSMGVDAAISIAGDCLFGEPPRCGAELLDVIADNNEENNNALADCEVACLSGQADLSADCLGCFADVVVCASANCVSECAGGAFLPECQTCRIDNNCDADFVDCSGVQGTVAGTVTVTVTEAPSLEDLFGGEPLEGVELCETDTSNCATTDAAGGASITVTLGEETSYALVKDGYLRYLVPVLASGATSSTWPMLSEQLAEEFGDNIMIPYPWTGGSIALAAFSLRAGVTFELVGETVPGYYTDEDGLPVPTPMLTETTSTGRGGFVEVSPGEYEVEFGGTATACTRSFGWPASSANRIKLPVRAGYLTYGSVNSCSAQ